ncbi:uncharacterized protein E5676_scaffold108G001050 [Cucumis melo var. makuwa]|uniref:CACTA en-spm transposon protein n=1 Tax=Cucumis melo var. makuwa TaxID=1194695 RepID=A0A5A7THJ4_CUCMM|nr:uncharacterized protein E6C27_scaffold44G003990 [Cucumis melo var. makuwa]TYK05285.1 uncharacterized protein E5676_scaffold108G001050 [Cucumis melo var. makuwa]
MSEMMIPFQKIRTDVDHTIIERLLVHHVTDDFIDDGDEQLSHESGTSDDEWYYVVISERQRIHRGRLGRPTGYSKGLGWEPKPKAHKMARASSAMTSCLQSTVELQLRVELYEAKRAIEEQTRKQDTLASEVERTRKLIEDMTGAQQGPPHDP